MIKKLNPEDIQSYRNLRLEGLTEKPHYFGASVQDERNNTDEVYLDGFGANGSASFVLGKFLGSKLVGVIGFRRFAFGNLRHKASLWGMYVAPEHREKGIGAELVKGCLEIARKVKGLETIQLAVESKNRPAQKLYSRFGFKRFAQEKRALKVKGEYYDEIWMKAELKDKNRTKAGGGWISHSAVAIAVLGLLGCATRKYVIRENQIDFATESNFYLVLNEEANKVQYSYFNNPLDFEKYGGGRSKESYVLEVPGEIAKYLMLRAKHVEMGTRAKSPSKDTVVINYSELWGWDMGRILKWVKISMYKGTSATDTASVEFKEMTIFNSRPKPQELIPKMLDTLFLQSKMKFDKGLL